jgi:uncharacterized protein
MPIDRTFLTMASLVALAACVPARDERTAIHPQEKPLMNASPKTPREIWEQIAAHQQTRDIDAYLACFADDAVLEWPFTPPGFPRRLEGREAIRSHVGPVWERAKQTNRQITGHEHLQIHETAGRDVVIIEFDLVGKSAAGPWRQPMMYLLKVRDGRIVLLKEYVDTAGLSRLFQATAPS